MTTTAPCGARQSRTSPRAARAIGLTKTQITRLIAAGRLRQAPRTIVGAPGAVTIGAGRMIYVAGFWRGVSWER